ncbi:uncharacterized protein FFB14_08589 [Fusarium fujikuroi]|nr:uncharacterized protein FFB14_08589 [Fusarium fujikuroi]
MPSYGQSLRRSASR